jgi:hypothetical protein
VIAFPARAGRRDEENNMWIMIIIAAGVAYGGGSGVTTNVASVEFSSRERCEVAARQVPKQVPTGRISDSVAVTVVCVER